MKALLYSGGLDSYLLAKKFDYDIYLFFDMGGKDNKKEWEKIQQVPFLRDKAIKIDSLKLTEYVLPNKIVPFRNYLLGILAANYADEIHFGFTYGDITKDKDYVFKGILETILNYFGQDENKMKHNGYPLKIGMPYKDMTKAEMIKEYLDDGGDINELLANTTSCYMGGEKDCGHCRSCLRKYIAFKFNGIDIRETYENNPIPKLKEFSMMPDILKRKKEIDQINSVIKELNL